MSDQDQVTITHSFNAELREGDVALIFRADGEPEIQHNIPSLAETGVLQGGVNAGGIILALTAVNIMTHDENALTAGMRRVTMLLEGGKLRLVQ